LQESLWQLELLVGSYWEIDEGIFGRVHRQAATGADIDQSCPMPHVMSEEGPYFRCDESLLLEVHGGQHFANNKFV